MGMEPCCNQFLVCIGMDPPCAGLAGYASASPGYAIARSEGAETKPGCQRELEVRSYRLMALRRYDGDHSAGVTLVMSVREYSREQNPRRDTNGTENEDTGLNPEPKNMPWLESNYQIPSA